MIALLDVPDAIHVQLVDGSVFGVFTASWLLVIIFDLITMFMVFSLLLEVAERYMVLAMLTVMAPLAFAMGGSKSTSEIFSGWCRMFGSMCFLMATNIVFFKMLLSVVSTVPSFPDVFLWMVLIVSIVKVAKKGGRNYHPDRPESSHHWKQVQSPRRNRLHRIPYRSVYGDKGRGERDRRRSGPDRKSGGGGLARVPA